MTNKAFVGIDVSKDKLDLHLMTSSNRKKQCCVSNDSAGFNKALTWLNTYSSSPVVCLEATGHYSEGVAEFLSKAGLFVSIVNPYQVKQFGKVYLKRSKNDIIDSQTIAQYAKAMEPRRFSPRSKAFKLIRELTKTRSLLVGQITQLKNQLESTKQKPAAKLIQQTITSLQKQIIRLDKQLSTAIEEDPTFYELKKRLLEIKGVGEASIASLIAYLPDISQFQSAKQLAAFAGLSPKQNQSGQYEGKTRISKVGCPDLRNALYMPALSAKRYNTALSPFVRRLEASGHRPKQIVIAVMRKLLHIIYGMIKSGQRFNPALACQA